MKSSASSVSFEKKASAPVPSAPDKEEATPKAASWGRQVTLGRQMFLKQGYFYISHKDWLSGIQREAGATFHITHNRRSVVTPVKGYPHITLDISGHDFAYNRKEGGDVIGLQVSQFHFSEQLTKKRIIFHRATEYNYKAENSGQASQSVLRNIQKILTKAKIPLNLIELVKEEHPLPDKGPLPLLEDKPAQASASVPRDKEEITESTTVPKKKKKGKRKANEACASPKTEAQYSPVSESPMQASALTGDLKKWTELIPVLGDVFSGRIELSKFDTTESKKIYRILTSLNGDCEDVRTHIISSNRTIFDEFNTSMLKVLFNWSVIREIGQSQSTQEQVKQLQEQTQQLYQQVMGVASTTAQTWSSDASPDFPIPPFSRNMFRRLFAKLQQDPSIVSQVAAALTLKQVAFTAQKLDDSIPQDIARGYSSLCSELLDDPGDPETKRFSKLFSEVFSSVNKEVEQLYRDAVHSTENIHSDGNEVDILNRMLSADYFFPVHEEHLSIYNEMIAILSQLQELIITSPIEQIRLIGSKDLSRKALEVIVMAKQQKGTVDQLLEKCLQFYRDTLAHAQSLKAGAS